MAHEDQLWRIAERELAAGRPVVVCTVVASHGSTPRELGARMLMGGGGLLAGTVGGGCGEADVAAVSRKLLAGHGSPGVVEVDLSGDFEQNAIQACGGTMDVSVELLGSGKLELVAKLARAEADRTAVRLASQVSHAPGESGSWHVARAGETVENLPEPVAAVMASEAPKLVRCGQELWFVSTVGTREEIVIVGSGHVAQPLARMASYLGYRVVVVDDRPEYTTRERFPEASEVLVGAHAECLSRLKLDAHSHIVIITRGHQHDESSLRESLKQSPAYVGMIGSKRRAIGTLKRLGESGFDSGKLAAVHTPIGLDIGAQTPEEIALAVMAEIVCMRRGATGRPLRDLRPGDGR